MTADPAAQARFFDLLAEAHRAYRDLAAENATLAAERDRLIAVVEGLLGVLGKYVDEAEIERWRSMAGGRDPR
jgi:hypothetical protein